MADARWSRALSESRYNDEQSVELERRITSVLKSTVTGRRDVNHVDYEVRVGKWWWPLFWVFVFYMMKFPVGAFVGAAGALVGVLLVTVRSKRA